MAVHKLMLMPIWELCKKPNIVAAVIVAGFVSGTFVPDLVLVLLRMILLVDDLTTVDTVISRQLFS